MRPVSPCNFYFLSIYIIALVLYFKRKSSITAPAPLTTKLISKQARLNATKSVLIQERLLSLFMVCETMSIIGESRTISHANDRELHAQQVPAILAEEDFTFKLLRRTPIKIHRRGDRRRQPRSREHRLAQRRQRRQHSDHKRVQRQRQNTTITL